VVGYLPWLHDQWASTLLRKVRPNAIQAALAPPEPLAALPDRTLPASPDEVVATLRGDWQRARETRAERAVDALHGNQYGASMRAANHAQQQ
jgi:hypothetical protein